MSEKNTKIKNEDLNYHYLNTELELVAGVPASVLLAWVPSLILMNISVLFFSVFMTILIIVLYRSGYTIIETVSIIKYTLRDQKIKLLDSEEKYDKNI